MAALNEQDVVDVGSSGALVQRQPLQTDVSWQVFVQHSRTWGGGRCCWLKMKRSLLPLNRVFINKMHKQEQFFHTGLRSDHCIVMSVTHFT